MLCMHLAWYTAGMHHWIFGGLAVFCMVHIYRDYLQIKHGYTTWFTRVGHVWDAPQYEKHGMVVFAVLAVVFGLLAIR